jgi:hypothetical protein
LGRGVRDFRTAISGIDPREDLVSKPELDTGQAAARPTASAAAPTAATAAGSLPSSQDHPSRAA